MFCSVMADCGFWSEANASVAAFRIFQFFFLKSSLFEDFKNFAAVIKFLKGEGFGERSGRRGSYRNRVLKLYFDIEIICIIGLFP